MLETEWPVIAVFGGAKDEPTLDAAEQVGYEIGRRHAILLTGGDDQTATDLKGRVLTGAVRARQHGASAPWVGVIRTKLASDPVPAADGLSLVLAPGGDHLRNYAEAELCDAAIAFAGGPGTTSEVVFCLALGKRLVLVGDHWLSRYPVVSRADARKALKEEAQMRVPPHPEHPRLGPPISDAYEGFDGVVEPSFQHFSPPPRTFASVLVEAVIQAARTGGRPDASVGSLATERGAIRQFCASLPTMWPTY
jgi:predicted Rossmann-fold nucleotide-binding protein